MELLKAKLAKNMIPDHLSTIEENSYPMIPLDIVAEIFKELPAKTLTRFLCVSKESASIIRNRDFMNSYLFKSSDLPQSSLIFTLRLRSKNHKKHFFFSANQPQNRGESSSSSRAIYQMKCCSKRSVTPSVHGLICYGTSSELMVYNPSTRRSITLPKIDSERRDMDRFLGYDPIDGDYKVLCVVKDRKKVQEVWVLTLGKDKSWRMLKDCPTHYPESPDICMDGFLYYHALIDSGDTSEFSEAVMRFDVRSEKFDLIKHPETIAFSKLTCYEGKLAIMFSYRAWRIHLWVLVDAAKHEWSKKEFGVDLPRTESFFNALCVTDAGEFVLAVETMCAPLYVVYYDPKNNTLRRVYIEGLTALKLPLGDKDWGRCSISIFPGLVENLMFL